MSLSIIILTIIIVVVSAGLRLPGSTGPKSGQFICDSSFLTPDEIGTSSPTDIWCAINVITGVKTCPDPGSTAPIYTNGVNESCTRSNRCDVESLPYTVLTGVSGNTGGISPPGLSGRLCEPGIDCRCVSRPQCPDYISSVFNTESGNINLPPGQLVLGQQTVYTTFTGNIIKKPPLIYDDPSQQFCYVNSSLIGNMGGSCPGSIGDCMSESFNPCQSGQLAFIGRNTLGGPSNLVGCVSRDNLPGCTGQCYLFDPQVGGSCVNCP